MTKLTEGLIIGGFTGFTIGIILGSIIVLMVLVDVIE